MTSMETVDHNLPSQRQTNDGESLSFKYSSAFMAAPFAKRAVSTKTLLLLQICFMNSGAQSVLAKPFPVRKIEEKIFFCRKRSPQAQRILSAIFAPEPVSRTLGLKPSSSSSCSAMAVIWRGPLVTFSS